MPSSLNLIHDVRGGGSGGVMEFVKTHSPSVDVLDYINTNFGTIALNPDIPTTTQTPETKVKMNIWYNFGGYFNPDSKGAMDRNGASTSIGNLESTDFLRMTFLRPTWGFMYLGKFVPYCFFVKINSIKIHAKAGVTGDRLFTLYSSRNGILKKLGESNIISMSSAASADYNLILSSQSFEHTYHLTCSGTTALYEIYLYGSLKQLQFNF